MNDKAQRELGKTLWNIADQLRGAMNADDFRDYMLSFLFLRYLSSNYEKAAKKELGRDYPKCEDGDALPPLALWYEENPDDVAEFEKQMRRKVHYVVKPDYLWENIVRLAKTQDGDTPRYLAEGFQVHRGGIASRAASRACSPRSTSPRTSSGGSTKTATPSSAPSSRKSRAAWRSSPPTPTPSATPTNT